MYNACITETRRIRPDLFMSQAGYKPKLLKLGSKSLSDLTFGLPEFYLMPVCYYIVAQFEAADTEEQAVARTSGYMQSYQKAML